MFVIRHKTFFLIASCLLVVVSLSAVGVYGLHFSIDFTGGSLVEVRYPSGAPSKSAAEEALTTIELGSFTLQPTETNGVSGFILRTGELRNEERELVLGALSLNGAHEIIAERFTSIGPSLGEELKRKAFVAVGVVLGMIMLFIIWAFRKRPVQDNRARKEEPVPVSSWMYGVVALLTLIHDVAVPTGVFAVLGAFLGVEIDILFITALLAILGFSIHDTIVVFDRIRENVQRNANERNELSFPDVVGKSINETWVRSINTSLTVFLTLLALVFLGASSTRFFTIALTVGIAAGTTSSILLASPLLIFFAERRHTEHST